MMTNEVPDGALTFEFDVYQEVANTVMNGILDHLKTICEGVLAIYGDGDQFICDATPVAQGAVSAVAVFMVENGCSEAEVKALFDDALGLMPQIRKSVALNRSQGNA